MTNEEMFTVREENGLRLITPSHSAAVANAPWSRETLHYRSRVETLDGQTVSQGFKKFFNLGTGPSDLQITALEVMQACERHDAVATLKVDGSLLIRSECDGKLMFRTRGSFGYEHLDNAAEMDLFRQKYPRLFEYQYFSAFSLLLEWVSPANTIVIRYPEPQLTLIGGIYNRDLRYLSMLNLESIAEYLGVPVVRNYRLTTEGWKDLQATLDTRPDIEGFVIRINQEQDLVKVKAAPYLTKHALKSTLTTEKLVDLYFQQNEPSYDQFCKEFSDSFDEEICMWAIGAISAMFDGVKTYNTITAHMRAKAKERASMTRKDAALAGLAEYGQTKRFSAYMQMWEGKEVGTDLRKSILLQNTKQVELGMFKNSHDEG